MFAEFPHSPLVSDPYQLYGTKWMLQRRDGFLFDEPGLGKSKQAIDYACQMFEDQAISTVVVVCPAYVRSEWENVEIGHVGKFAWVNQEHRVHLFDSYNKDFSHTDPGALLWVVLSYDLCRNKVVLGKLIGQLATRGPWLLILDECSQIMNRSAQRTKGVKELRKHADYCFGLNGSPIANSVMDLWSQFDIVAPEALRVVDGVKYWQFRDRWAKLGGWKGKVVVGIRNEAELWEKLKPWVLLRMAKDYLNLEEPVYKLAPVPLGQKAWQLYLQMREDLVATLEDATSTAVHAGAKAVRLAQLTAGFLGGARGDCKNCGQSSDDHSPDECLMFDPEIMDPIEVDDAKLLAALEWADQHEVCVLWTRFRVEAQRLHARLERQYPGKVGLMIGGLGKDRDRIKVDFQTGRIDKLVANPAAASMGINLQRAHHAAYLSNDWSWLNREQSERRLIRKGQDKVVVVTDFIGTSPNGRRTIDWTIREKLKAKERLSNMSKQAWKTELLR